MPLGFDRRQYSETPGVVYRSTYVWLYLTHSVKDDTTMTAVSVSLILIDCFNLSRFQVWHDTVMLTRFDSLIALNYFWDYARTWAISAYWFTSITVLLILGCKAEHPSFMSVTVIFYWIKFNIECGLCFLYNVNVEKLFVTFELTIYFSNVLYLIQWMCFLYNKCDDSYILSYHRATSTFSGICLLECSLL